MNHCKHFIMMMLVFFSLVFVAVAQDETLPTTDTTYVWSVGVLNADNTVFYSVTVGVGAEDLNGATITTTLPEGVSFVAESWMPEDADFAGVTDNVASWTIETLIAETFVGPFTVQVEFEDSDAEDFAVPATILAGLIWDGGAAENTVSDATISPLAESGTIEITPEGTADELVSVGKTGIWILVPAGAVTETITLTFTHVPLLEPEAGPEIEGAPEDTWWCAQVNISADADVTFAQPILMVLTTRRAITPLTLIPVFTQNAGEEWVLASDPETQAEALVGYRGNSTYLVFNEPTFNPAGQQIAIGTTLKSGTTITPTISNINNRNSLVPVVINHEEQFR